VFIYSLNKKVLGNRKSENKKMENSESFTFAFKSEIFWVNTEAATSFETSDPTATVHVVTTQKTSTWIFKAVKTSQKLLFFIVYVYLNF